MVVDDTIAQALNRIADGQDEINDTLKRIANHYDGVVPVMTRNAERVEKAHEEDVNEPKQWDDKLKSIFSPQGH